MPNWCYTRIIFHGNKIEIEDFHSKIDDWTSKPYIETDFGKAWLGNILYGAGLMDRNNATRAGIRCRGTIAYMNDVEVFSEALHIGTSANNIITICGLDKLNGYFDDDVFYSGKKSYGLFVDFLKSITLNQLEPYIDMKYDIKYAKAYFHTKLRVLDGGEK